MCQFLSQARLLAASLILNAGLLTHSVFAQEAQPGMARRPEPMATAVGISPELEKILETWESKSGKLNRMKGDFSRIEYDQTFSTAKTTNGRYWYEFPDKGRMDFIPDAELVKNPGKSTATRGNVTFSVIADEPKTWLCDGVQILDIDHSKREFNRASIPPMYRGKNISDGPLPFLFGLNANKMKERYILEIGSMHDPRNIIHIVAYPKMANEQREYRVAEVLLDANEFLPRAIQLLDPTGNKQTVYMFTNHDKVTLPFLPTQFAPPGLLTYKKIMDDTSSLDREAKKDGIMLR